MIRIALVLVAAATTAMASLAEAQPLASFDRLGLRLNQGDFIAVTDRTGRELRGRLIDLSPTTLSLQIDNGLHDLEEAEVSSIRRRHRDSLKNGALAGFFSGAVVVGILTADEGSSGGVYKLLAMSLFGAAGAGIGVGFDAWYEQSQIVYTAERSTRRVAVLPLLSRDRRGLALSLGF